MNTKEQAYRLHAFLKARGVESLKRSHVHELLAAAMGYSSHAAFQHEATWCDVPFADTGIAPDLQSVSRRCRELGIPAADEKVVPAGMELFLRDSRHAPVRFESLISAFDDAEEGRVVEDWIRTEICPESRGSLQRVLGSQTTLLHGLEAAAARGVPAAHLAIARMIESDAAMWGDDHERVRRQVIREGNWTSPFVSFAETENFPLRIEEKFRHHLLGAARAGDLRALMETAELYGDPGILRREPTDEMDPIAMVQIAAEHGDDIAVRAWLTTAARDGDVGAMRELILEHDEPTEQAWVWMHLSRLLGQDLSQDRFEAINEDGSSYDDDVGGPVYVGGEAAIELEPLQPAPDASARQTAQELFANIDRQLD